MRIYLLPLVALLCGQACRRASPISVEWVKGNPDTLRVSSDRRMLLRGWPDHFDVIDSADHVVTSGKPGERAIGAPDEHGRTVVLQPDGEVLGRDRAQLTKLTIPAGARLIDTASGDLCAVTWASGEHADHTEVAMFRVAARATPS